MAGMKNGDLVYTKWGTGGKNTEKEGFRKNYPGHGYTNSYLYTGKRRQQNSGFIISQMKHITLPCKQITLDQSSRQGKSCFNLMQRLRVLPPSPSGNFLTFFFFINVLLCMNSNKFIYWQSTKSPPQFHRTREIPPETGFIPFLLYHLHAITHGIFKSGAIVLIHAKRNNLHIEKCIAACKDNCFLFKIMIIQLTFFFRSSILFSSIFTKTLSSLPL